MKSVITLFVLYSNFIYAEDKLVPNEIVKTALGALSQVHSVGTAPVGLCGKHDAPVVDFLECAQAKELNQSIRINFQKEGWKRKAELDLLVATCFQKRFEKCYPALKSNIDLGQIKTLFNEWKKDPRFRYPAGAGMCAYRAEALSYHLAELGFKTTTIRIGHSPTLIAMDRDANDLLNGNYDDYHGAHTVVQIMVNVNDEQIPYLLDPQYMTEPMPRNMYFIKTMGQVCEETENEMDLTNCYFKQKLPNSMPDGHDLFNPSKMNDSAVNCGWSSGDVKTRISIWPKPIIKTDGKIVKTNGGDTPEFFKDKIVSEKTSKELIIKAYEDYALSLKSELDKINSSLAIRSEIPRDKENVSPYAISFANELKEIQEEQMKRKESLIFSLKKIDKKIIAVKKNLDSINN